MARSLHLGCLATCDDIAVLSKARLCLFELTVALVSVALLVVGVAVPSHVRAKPVQRMVLPKPMMNELTGLVLATEALANAYRAQDDEQIEIGLRDLQVAVTRSRLMAKARLVPLDRMPAAQALGAGAGAALQKGASMGPLSKGSHGGTPLRSVGRGEDKGAPLLTPAMEFHLSKQLEPLRQMIDVTRNSPHSERRDRVADIFVSVAHLVRVYAFDSRFHIFFCPQNRMTWVQSATRGQYPFADTQLRNCAVRAP